MDITNSGNCVRVWSTKEKDRKLSNTYKHLLKLEKISDISDIDQSVHKSDRFSTESHVRFVEFKDKVRKQSYFIKDYVVDDLEELILEVANFYTGIISEFKSSSHSSQQTKHETDLLEKRHLQIKKELTKIRYILDDTYNAEKPDINKFHNPYKSLLAASKYNSKKCRNS